jgi:hypothetical protein
MTMKPAGLVQSGIQMVGILQRILPGSCNVRQGDDSFSIETTSTYIMAGMMILGLNLDRINDPGSWVMMYPTVRSRCKAECQQGESKAGVEQRRRTVKQRDSCRPFHVAHMQVFLHPGDSGVGHCRGLEVEMEIALVW